MESFRENVRAKLREISSGRSHGLKHLCWELGLLELGHSRANYLRIYEQIGLTDKDMTESNNKSLCFIPNIQSVCVYFFLKDIDSKARQWLLTFIMPKSVVCLTS